MITQINVTKKRIEKENTHTGIYIHICVCISGVYKCVFHYKQKLMRE